MKETGAARLLIESHGETTEDRKVKIRKRGLMMSLSLLLPPLEELWRGEGEGGLRQARRRCE